MGGILGGNVERDLRHVRRHDDSEFPCHAVHGFTKAIRTHPTRAAAQQHGEDLSDSPLVSVTRPYADKRRKLHQRYPTVLNGKSRQAVSQSKLELRGVGNLDLDFRETHFSGMGKLLCQQLCCRTRLDD